MFNIATKYITRSLRPYLFRGNLRFPHAYYRPAQHFKQTLSAQDQRSPSSDDRRKLSASGSYHVGNTAPPSVSHYVGKSFGLTLFWDVRRIPLDSRPIIWCWYPETRISTMSSYSPPREATLAEGAFHAHH